MAEIIDFTQQEPDVETVEILASHMKAALRGELRGVALVAKHTDGQAYMSYGGEWDERMLAEGYLMLDDMMQDIKAHRNETGES